MSEMKPNPENEKKGGALPPLGSAADGGSKLPSFKSSLSKKKPVAAGGGAGKAPAAVPTWGSAGVDKLAGAPMFRGAGAMAAKKSLLGRLKGLKTKDMAFIAAGLGVLVMAPLAEYLISDGGADGAVMSEGFDRKGGFFAEPQDLYEAGLEGIAPGGVMGRDTDVITPLNVRDPSSLIMAPGGQREETAPPTASIDEPKRDAPKDDTDWKKIIDSAKSGVTEATKKVKLPTPSVKMTGALSGLKGLAGGGSTQARLSLAAPTTPGAQRPSGAGSNLSRTQAVPGFRGAGRSLAGGGGTASGGFGRASNPGGTTGESASAYGGISGGGKGTGYGSPTGDGEPTKNPGGSGTKDSKTLGENLAFLRAKMNMEKAIDLKWAKKRYNELERKKMLEQMAAQTAQQAFMKILDRLLKGNEGEKGGGGGGGSPGGGSGGDPAGEEGKTGEGTQDGGTPFPVDSGGNADFASTIGTGDKANPAHKNGEQAQSAAEKANSSFASEKGTLSSLLANLGDGSGDAELGAFKQAADAAAAAKDPLGEGEAGKMKEDLDNGKAKIQEVQTVVDKEVAQVTQIGMEIGKSAGILRSHKTEGTGDDEKYSGQKDFSSIKPEYKKPEVPGEFKAANLGLSGKVRDRAAEAKQAADAALRAMAPALQKVNTLESRGTIKPDPELRGNFGKIKTALATMSQEAQNVGSATSGWENNVRAMQEKVNAARTALEGQAAKNEALKGGVETAVEKGNAWDKSWTGLVKDAPQPKADKPSIEQAFTDIKGKVSEEKAATGKITTDNLGS